MYVFRFSVLFFFFGFCPQPYNLYLVLSVAQYSLFVLKVPLNTKQPSISILTAIFPGGPGLAGTRNVSILDFIGAKDDGAGYDNWSYETCKGPVGSSPPTNQHPIFLQAGCPFCRPCNSVRALMLFQIYLHYASAKFTEIG